MRTSDQRAGSLRVVGILVALAGIGSTSALVAVLPDAANIFNILLQSSNVAIIAAGLTVVMITAEIDLSIGSLQALAGSVAAVVIITHGVPVLGGIARGSAATVLCGRVSGFLTWKLKVVSFISTLAMLGIAQGVAFLLTNGQAVAGFPRATGRSGPPRSTGSRAPRSSRSSSSSCSI